MNVYIHSLFAAFTGVVVAHDRFEAAEILNQRLKDRKINILVEPTDFSQLANNEPCVFLMEENSY